ncbi:hypothetical protein SAMN03159341_1055 [Paenibacillus sp. 1_12]|uniref:hypothetical protein n=1 Tax=Paenibacillus sp. 1_12 TaxID=1566278 RepID=UPI0008E519E6|nr:hypothetical protein [Paenibacillus sp. 1_12]SFL30954.1 hypothetical protein SAMN03159341_1055 [Paenibacillus sp. 1_12]
MIINHYQIPPTLKKLKALDNNLQEQYQSNLDDYLGFKLIDRDEEDDYRYHCTPSDAIVFATTGMDGDHFSFNTINGTIENLEEASILFTQPMDSEKPNKIVARNIKDLLSLFINLKELYILERFDWYQIENDFINDYEENYLEAIMESEDEINFIIDKLISLFELKVIDNAYNYITELRKPE